MSSYKVSHAELSDKRVYPMGPDVSQLRNQTTGIVITRYFQVLVKDTLINKFSNTLSLFLITEKQISRIPIS